MFICSRSSSSSVYCLKVLRTSCYSFTFITTLSDVHKDAGDEEEECRDDAVNNTDDNLVRAHRLEHC